MTLTGEARALLETAEQRRAEAARYEEINPARAAIERREAARKGRPSHYDDPTVEVRCAVLERMCRHILGIPEPIPEGQLFAEVPL